MYAADLAAYARDMAEDNSRQMGQVKRNLIRALKSDITEKQRLELLLYYGKGMTMTEISRRLGVHPSTVSRTIRRGEERLRRCLRYGAEAFFSARSGD